MSSIKKENDSLQPYESFEITSNPYPNSVQITTFPTETVIMSTPDFAKALLLEGSSNFEAWAGWIRAQCLVRGVNAILQGKTTTPVADVGETPAVFGTRSRTHAKELEFIEGLIYGACKEGSRALIASEEDPIR